jgi:predicted NUDIX family NTP pyrophosphohydrolase
VQSRGKTVHGFAIEADLDLGGFRSTQFEMEWPPHSGRKAQFPEIDRVAYFTYEQALRKIIGYQRPFIEELKRKLGRS